ncbi:alpha-tocopherol transfer protein-like [Zophobas morio]|uniref:alpha-tocopherol transfer protein-like n=1 Tax=Zophobas morio TaxID=2755281 RepID=UPI003083D2BF
MVLRVETDANNVPFVQLGKHKLRLDLEDLDESFKERAKEELGETPEVVERSLRQFKKYVSGETQLFVPIDDEDFLLKFLRPFRFNPEIAFKVFKKFYKFKLIYPKYGLNLMPNEVRKVFDNDVFLFLPARTPSGSRIMLINGGTKWNPKLITLQDLFRTVMVAIEMGMMEPKTQVAGVEVILNMEGLSLSHVAQFSPSTAKLMADWVQECAPVRLKGIHVINQSKLFNIAYAIFKPFIGEKLREKLYFHGSDRKVLTEKLSKEALPKSLGGCESSLEYPGYLLSEMMFYYEKTFERHNTYRYITEKVIDQ